MLLKRDLCILYGQREGLCAGISLDFATKPLAMSSPINPVGPDAKTDEPNHSLKSGDYAFNAYRN